MTKQYAVQVFYDPRTMDINLLRQLYVTNGLSPASEESMKTPFFKDTVNNLEVAVTTYDPLTKAQAISLSEILLELDSARVEIDRK